ncbi:hypothetical protein CIHG_10013 [Coccidioides immitis H538.4]|uniref:Uncharacterized protein n=1 Tax=Coccidioides immitis H538.4 TaxID=396776 RepID=A0A0J8S5U9_COCIT|nr:hypothetical protein CIHG_10013 [Coccidioides immitis H538.4]
MLARSGTQRRRFQQKRHQRANWRMIKITHIPWWTSASLLAHPRCIELSRPWHAFLFLRSSFSQLISRAYGLVHISLAFCVQYSSEHFCPFALFGRLLFILSARLPEFRI